MILIVGAAFTVLLAWRSLAAREAAHGEFHALLLTSVAGMSVLASRTEHRRPVRRPRAALDPPLCPSARPKRREHSLESGLKYLIVGSVGSATLLYGLALIYGATARPISARSPALSSDSLATDPLTLDRDRAVRRRPLLQGVRGALPPVDARRLRGRADPGHGVHGGDHEGRGASGVFLRFFDVALIASAAAGARRWRCSRRSRSSSATWARSASPR